MKINLRKLKLSYFKGFRSFEINITGDTAVIAGKNATGKSTIFDAFLWLLFGKDSLGNADFQIKTVENGKEISRVEHTVEGMLEIDGHLTTLTRTLKENWIKPRGAEKEILKGNETLCQWDGVPISVTEYQKRISEIIDEKTFRLITDLRYFHSLKTDERRAILVALAGDISDDVILNSTDEFKELIEILKNTNYSDIIKNINAEKKRINENIKSIPIRIDEIYKSMPESIDFAAVEDIIKTRENEIKEIDKLIANRQLAVKSQIDEANKKQKIISELKIKQHEIVNNANMLAMNAANENNKIHRAFKNEIETNKANIDNINNKIFELDNDIIFNNDKLNNYINEIDVLRSEWATENSKTYSNQSDVLICPIFGHECKDEEAIFGFAKEKESTERAFNENKIKKLNEINEKGKKLNEIIANINEKINKKQEEIKNYNAEKNKIIDTMKELEEQMPSYIEVVKEVKKEEICEWIELQKQIDTLQSEIKELNINENNDLLSKKEKINSEIQELNKKLNIKSQIEEKEKRIAELQAEQRLLTQELNKQEGLEFKLQKFHKIKMQEVDKRVNGLFSYVKFKLFDTTLDGNEYETCETLINDIPYFSANKGARIDGALDIINTISKHYNIYAPVFVDNSESVNRGNIIDMESQLILLRVTYDKKLRVINY